MCSNCHKRVAVIFVTKVENGEKSSQGLCVKCAKDLGLPVENMLGDIYNKMGITPDQIENMENELANALNDGGEDGGAPAVDFPSLFNDPSFMDTIKNVAENLPAPSNKNDSNIVPVNRDGGDKKKKEHG